MPARRREPTIDLEESDGSDADSYNSADDSEGSLRDFLVQNDVIECSDYEDEETGSDYEAESTDEDVPLPTPSPRRLRSRRAAAASARYVLPADMDEDDEDDEDYDPGEGCAVFEIDVTSRTLSNLDRGAQRFLEE